MIKSLAAAIVLMTWVALAQAAPLCFRPAEIEAEQGIRFQTELMVLSDACGDKTYTRFSQRNREVLTNYQQLMIQHFRRGGGHPEATFDRYMTRLANETALHDGSELLSSLCARSAGLLASAAAWSKDDFRRYAAAQATERAHEYRHCAE